MAEERTQIVNRSITLKCFRIRFYYFLLGVGGVVFSAVIGIGSTLAAIWNIDDSFARPLLAASIFGSFWSCFSLMCVWIIAAYVRERLILTESTLLQRGVVHTKSFEFSNIVLVTWRLRPAGGSVVICTDSEKVKIELAQYSAQDRAELVQILRDKFGMEIQHGWHSFNAVFSRSPERIESPEGSIIIALVLGCFACVFVYCWFMGLGKEYLLIGSVNVIACTWYLRRFHLLKKSATSKGSAE